MDFAGFASRLSRTQRSRRFKIIATCVIAALGIASFIALQVAAHAPGAEQKLAERAAERAKEKRSGLLIDRGPLDALGVVLDSVLLTIRPIEGVAPPQPEAPPETPASGATAPETQEDPIDAPRAVSGGWLVAGAITAIVAGLSALIWLGIGITSLGLFALAWLVAWPLMSVQPTATIGRILMASAPLALAFTTGMALLKAALGAPTPLFAVARNVLQEAIRMRVSLVFIVLLILLLSYAPQSLNEAQPLRYRVQQWMQYGMGLSYALLALLTLFLSVGTVAFEQRDKVIWQTMTKPVPHWQYVLGKWVGVMGLNLILLSVTASGVFLFTEYLRHQPAQQEIAYQVRNDGAVTLGRPDLQTDDRRLLESQVLVARVGTLIKPFFSDEWLDRAVDDQIRSAARENQSVQETASERARIREELLTQRAQRFQSAIEDRILDMRSNDPGFEPTSADRARIAEEVRLQQEALYRTVPKGSAKIYLFTGLESARAPGTPQAVTLRYRVNAGSNDPAQIYRVRFALNGAGFERQVALGSSQTLLFDKRIIAPDGSVVLGVENDAENQFEISFPPDGLEILYVAGGYEMNFLRIILVMWIKLGFTAAVAIAAATFLSFPVACLVSMTVLLSAETAGYLAEALEYYVSMTKEGIDYMAVVVRVIAVPISRIFSVYAELKPTQKLVDGRLVGWDTLFSSIVVLGTWSAAVLALGWALFRRRELATYSGR